MSCLDCHVINLPYGKMFEVTAQGRVWPCCHLASHYDEKHPIEDNILLEKFENDPDWNNIDKHPIDEILDGEMFTEIFPSHEKPQGAFLKTCQVYCKKD